MARPVFAAAFAAALFALPAAAQDVVADATEQPVSCLILPFDSIDVAAPTNGVVAEVLVERGQPVKRGDLLVRLDDSIQSTYLATVKAKAGDDSQLKQAQVRLGIAQTSVDRNRPVFEKKLLKGDEWDQILGTSQLAAIEVEASRSALRLAQLEVDRAEAALRQTRILAPADAVVIDIDVSVGEAAGNAPLVKLAVIDPLKVELFVASQSYARWKAGQKVSLRGSNAPDNRLEAVVKVVDPVADAGTGVIRVQLELPNPDLAVLAGQQCQLLSNPAP